MAFPSGIINQAIGTDILQFSAPPRRQDHFWTKTRMNLGLHPTSDMESKTDTHTQLPQDEVHAS
jgi:hypothetical protein